MQNGLLDADVEIVFHKRADKAILLLLPHDVGHDQFIFWSHELL